jgi:hypothetical protein
MNVNMKLLKILLSKYLNLNLIRVLTLYYVVVFKSFFVWIFFFLL